MKCVLFFFFFRIINQSLTEHAENTQGTKKKEEKQEK